MIETSYHDSVLTCDYNGLSAASQPQLHADASDTTRCDNPPARYRSISLSGTVDRVAYGCLRYYHIRSTSQERNQHVPSSISQWCDKSEYMRAYEILPREMIPMREGRA
jgi:hypothetical protein